MTNTVYPIGYSAAGAEQRIAELMEQTNMLLIDTRLKPYSWREAWRKEALQAKWNERYRWAGRVLGNSNYRGGPIEIVDPATGIRGLQMYLDEGHDLILLCECATWDHCHRKVIVEKLLEARTDVRVVLPEASAQVETIPCLSIQQPWCYLLANGLKDIENRDWNTNYRGPVLLHAGKKPDGDCFCEDKSLSPGFERRYGPTLAKAMPQTKADYTTGAIIGMATLVDVVTESTSPWFRGEYGFVMMDAKPFVEPIPYRGELKLFQVPRSVIASAVLGEPVTLSPEEPEPEPVVVPSVPEPIVEVSPRVARTLERCKKLNVSPEELTVRVFRNIHNIADLSDEQYAELNTALLRLELMWMEMQKKTKKKVSKR
ncbi:MAG TPA: hypothetical protein VGN34_25390 [Ktedonobacteraceae bacterium]|jgi:hypothetical protein